MIDIFFYCLKDMWYLPISIWGLYKGRKIKPKYNFYYLHRKKVKLEYWAKRWNKKDLNYDNPKECPELILKNSNNRMQAFAYVFSPWRSKTSPGYFLVFHSVSIWIRKLHVKAFPFYRKRRRYKEMFSRKKMTYQPAACTLNCLMLEGSI